MKKYKVKVTRTNEYEIEFDEEIYNEEYLDGFKKVFHDFDDLSEHAEHIAQQRAEFQADFVEGYGIILVDGRKPFLHNEKDDFKIAKGVNIRILSNEDIDTEVEEINEKYDKFERWS